MRLKIRAIAVLAASILAMPALGQELHRLIRRATQCADPYAALKEALNQRAHALHPVWHRRFRAAHPPLEAAVRMAMANSRKRDA